MIALIMNSDMIDTIDLNLAESYRPAVLCAVRMFFIFSMYIVGSMLEVSSFSVFVFLCTVLYLDRCHRKESIIDTTVPTSTILASLIVNHHRNRFEGGMYNYSALLWNTAWSAYSVGLTFYTPGFLQPEMHRLYLTAFFFLLHAWTIPLSEDSLVQLGGRMVFFTAAALSWMYGIEYGQLRRDSLNHCTTCVIYFTPVLFVNPIHACFFGVLSSVAVLYRYKTHDFRYGSLEEELDLESQKKTDVKVNDEVQTVTSHLTPNQIMQRNSSAMAQPVLEDEAVMSAFRAARESIQKSSDT